MASNATVTDRIKKLEAEARALEHKHRRDGNDLRESMALRSEIARLINEEERLAAASTTGGREEMIQERLAIIQKELRAPKGQFNAFGKYKYRSCEDILEAVKPLLGDAILLINDELVMIGDRYYVKAKVSLYIGENSISATAYAREEEDKKGMDAAQITGACSSYARKYALNGLFLIDDTKDADTMDNTKDRKKAEDVPDYHEVPATETTKFATKEQVAKIQELMKGRGITEREKILEDLTGFCNRVIRSSKELSFIEANDWIKANIGEPANVPAT